MRELGAFAIRWSLSECEDYVKAGAVTVWTDHKSLQWMNASTSGRVHRWSLYISQFDVTIRHIAGGENVAADWLSRSYPDDEFGDCDIDEMAAPTATVEESTTSKVFAPYIPRPQQFRDGYSEAPKDEIADTYQGADYMRYHVKSMCPPP